MRSSIAWLACVALGTSCAARVGEEGSLPKLELFDGLTLAGWDGDARFWSVENGAIVGRSTLDNPCNETNYLVWRGGEVGDFELACEFKIDGGNSGVQFRSRDLGARQIAGYQADIEDGPNWTGCLYEQDGRGVIGKRGERVVLDADSRAAIALDDAAALLGRVRAHDWNEYVIRAIGPRIELAINGTRMLELVDRDTQHVATRGLLALQLHAGAPMRVEFKNFRLREFTAEYGARHTVSSAADATVSQAPHSAALVFEGAAPQWIWSQAESPDGELAAGVREFEIPFDVARATLRGACDDHVRVFLNGEFAGRDDEWWTHFEVDATRFVSRGTNVASFIGKNDGSLAAVWLELVVEDAMGRRLRVITDASWSAQRIDDAEFEAWTPAAFERTRASAPHSFGAYGVEPWESFGKSFRGENEAGNDSSSSALDGGELELIDGFRAELLYSVPKDQQGSWVALCEDDRGRLYASDQYGALYRITVGADANATRVEKLSLEIGSAQGLCWAFDSLYVVVSEGEAGLYRVRDTNADGELDDVALLRKFDGSGEHGPHAVALGPDGKLWVIAGNHTKLPEPLAHSRVPRTWGEDHLLPVIEDPNGHAVGIRAPGGWIARTDEDGASWELWAAGMRNAYDFAFDAEGEVFTYDSDMEWDIGAPWYKAPRVLHLVSGADFGWRSGTANWPTDYPDTLPSVCESGPASPTGVVFGTGASFPEKYCRALFVLDWAYGTIYAVHLTPKGASYTGELEKFCTGKPFPVTDAVVAKDGAMYVTTGGRKTQSGLYRITWDFITQRTSAADSRQRFVLRKDARSQVEMREIAETYQGEDTSSWSEVDARDFATYTAASTASQDPFVRRAAMAALAQFRPSAWFSPYRLGLPEEVGLCIAVLHADAHGQRDEVLRRVFAAEPGTFESDELVDYLRLVGLMLMRCPKLDGATSIQLRTKIDGVYPSSNQRVNRELALLLVALESPKVIDPLLATMESDVAQEEKIHAAYCLRALKTCWSLEQRKRFFVAMDELRATAKGGYSLAKYIDVIREQALETLSDEERAALGPSFEARKPSASVSSAPAATFVKRWTKEELIAELREPLHGRSFDGGKTAYAKANCAQCHRIGGEGGATGPDLTGAASRFSPSDLVEAIVEPSKAISDQYQDVELRTHDGELFVGRPEGERDGFLKFRRLPPDEDVIEIALDEIESRRLHSLSRMPAGALDVLTRDQVLDLFAFVLAGADPKHAAFR